MGLAGAAVAEASAMTAPARSSWMVIVRRHLRRALHQGHGGLMFNPPPAHGNPDSPGFKQ
jgi:hypothetical protein